MNCSTKVVGTINVVELSGELDANTSPAAQQQIMPLAISGAKILLDMSGVTFMSSAGLRLLLSTYRQVTALGGVVALAGLSDELKDTMSMTGFLAFFTVYDTQDAGLQALESGR